ncbi:ATP binding cassette (ABC) transporter subfamily C member [Diabrotica virgifera virgifera]|uniref:Multidrug resistance-associated protein 4-like n=1 Tax=Diabrotica virgifera virgifera TaxID=50390 RepID=A0A6P7FGR4_DIAVI|nr:ATP binding cassette (ABC) transporter subfamily C member [Diabrotica virgifera virgifera]
MDIGYKLKAENPKQNANIFSKIFFGWMIPLIRRGTKQNLEINDLYKTLKKDQSKRLTDALEKNWQKQVDKAKKKGGKPSVLMAISRTFAFEFMMYGILWAIQNVVLMSLKPILIAQLIELFTDDTSTRFREMYFFSTSLILVSLLIVFFFHHTNFGLQAIGMRIRVATSSLIYRKITRLNQKSLGETATGQIVNLLSNDVQRFDMVVVPLHALWVMPLQVAILMFIIWNQVGISSLAGVISMAIIALPVQGYMAKLMGMLRQKVSGKTDTRVKLMNEVIGGIQVIKMYAWEKPFEKVIKQARSSEIGDITKASYLRGVFSSFIVFLDRVALFFTVMTYVLLGNVISADIVFSLAQTFNILQTAMAIWYPVAISVGAEALVSAKRIQNFLIMEEREEASIEKIDKPGIILSNVFASWTTKGRTLQDISFQVPPGTLCAVVGPVGAGKSSLLQLLLGELPLKHGRVQLGGEVSYSSQEPWLFQSTVRNNILFGSPYEKRWYEKVVKVCALERDMEQFPQGDKTIVGEKGVSLSGGQRARINLARAIYRQADVYLMDDPLSAVDTHVGRHLFDQCILHHLRGKTRILVTHQLQYLKKAGLIVVLNDGKIEAQGTFEELMDSKMDFTKLLVAADETGEKHDKQEDADPEPVDFTRKFSSTRRFSVLSDASGEISLSMRSVDMTSDKNGEEEESAGDGKPFKDYLFATKNICFVIFVCVLMIMAQAFVVGVDLWLTFWTSQEAIRHENGTIVESTSPTVEIIPLHGDNFSYSYNYNYSYIPENNTNSFNNTKSFNINDIFDTVNVDGQLKKIIKTNWALYFYSGLIGLAIVFTLTRSLLFFKGCMMASVNLHSSMFHMLLKAPMRFFDTNPSGRILNRFSKDMGAIDELLPMGFLDTMQIMLALCGILVNITVSNAYIVIAIAILAAVFLKFRSWYISSARVLKHLEGITKSPVFSHINATLNGIITIRASNAQDVLIEEFDENQDANTSAWYLTIACMNSFGLWLDFLAIIFLAIVTFCFVILRKFTDVNGSLVGLAVSQCSALTGMLQFGMRQTAEIINQLTSVERVMQYTKLDTEGPFDTPEENRPRGVWPKRGQIEFRNLSLKYVENDPPVLRNLNFMITPGQKIGIVGRTGAGKSSLISALFRLAPLEGAIYIDGVNTKNLGLTDLRRKVSIIPQEPVLFSASLRYNLDPFNEFDDDKIWDALEQVELRDSVDSLDFHVAEGGGNFSLGQRQLVCLARAVLKNNKVLVLDEATANVDPRTDALIQATIRKRFKDCTVLTIAHRLNTIMDSDKVLVMSFGNMIEFDHPHKLLQIPDGHFHKMLLETGPVMSAQLKDVAMRAYQQE